MYAGPHVEHVVTLMKSFFFQVVALSLFVKPFQMRILEEISNDNDSKSYCWGFIYLGI